MPAEAPQALIPGLSVTAESALLSSLGVLAVLVAAPVLGWVTRRVLTTAGLRPPRPDDPGLDWSNFAGLVVGFTTLVLGLGVVLPAGTTQPVVPLLGKLFGVVERVGPALAVLATGDHYRRGTLERAERASKESRSSLHRKAERIRVWTLNCAAIAVFGDGIWSAWPLGVVILAVWVLHNPKTRPLMERTLADFVAGRRLRRTGLGEGAAVVADGEHGTLVDTVGLVDTLVRFPAGEKLVRNAELSRAEPLVPAASDPPALDEA